MPWNSPPEATRCSGGRSMWRMPEPAVIHWVSPLVITPPPPCESWCSMIPSIMYVTVSKPRCGCHGVPLGSPGAYSTSPIWSMWTNGSRSARDTPAKARRTGKPSPSSPLGAVVTCRTGRCSTVAGSGAGMRGRVRVSAVIAGMGSPFRLVELSTTFRGTSTPPVVFRRTHAAGPGRRDRRARRPGPGPPEEGKRSGEKGSIRRSGTGRPLASGRAARADAVGHRDLTGGEELLEGLAAERRVHLRVGDAEHGGHLLQHEEDRAVPDEPDPVAAPDQVLLLLREAVLVGERLEVVEEPLAVRRLDQPVQEVVDAEALAAALERVRVGAGQLLGAPVLGVDVLAVRGELLRVGLVADVLEDQGRDVGDRGGVGLLVHLGHRVGERAAHDQPGDDLRALHAAQPRVLGEAHVRELLRLG